MPERRETSTANFGHVHVMQFRAAPSEGAEGARVIEGFASTPAEDSYRERVLPTAFARDLPSYMANPLVTWMHNTYEVPIGRVEQAEVRPEGLWVRILLSRTVARAQEVWGAITEGLIRSMSIGFDGDYSPEWGHMQAPMMDGPQKSAPGADGVWVWERVRLREIAVVTLPANQEATFYMARSLGMQERPGLTEEDRALVYCDRLRSNAEGLRNLARHWTKDGGRPSAEVLGAAVKAMAVGAEVLKAGQVLSGANRTDLEAARDSITSVLDRDEKARAARETPGEDTTDEETPKKAVSITLAPSRAPTLTVR